VYEFKNLLLKYPADWFIEPETLETAKASLGDIIAFYEGLGTKDLKKLPLQDLVKQPLPEVYTLPLFSKKFCALLVDELQHMQKTIDFVPNPDEDTLRQIPEIVFNEHCPELFESLMTVVQNVVNPIFLSIWNRHVVGGNIQLANYNLKDKKQGAWHHDASSDISMVVPLNTGEYEGGGTEFFKRGTIYPLPTGNAMIFPSFTHMHRGLPVESGDRYLLVFWLKGDAETV
jgi:hypothetical protein